MDSGRVAGAELLAALDSAQTAIVFAAGRDWAASADEAWLYGILIGWDEDPTGGDVDQNGGAMAELAKRFGWTDEQVVRLRRLRAAVAGFDINQVGDSMRELDASLETA